MRSGSRCHEPEVPVGKTEGSQMRAGSYLVKPELVLTQQKGKKGSKGIILKLMPQIVLN